MAIFFDAPVEPDALTTFIRTIPFPSTLGLSNLFPVETTDDNTVDFAEIVSTNRTARYRSFDGRIHVSERDTGSSKRVPLIPLSSSLNMGEYERLQLEFARNGGTNQQALARAIYNDAERLTREVQFRLEQAWGDVLTDGKLTLNEGGLVGAEADFGVPGSQIVAPGTLWSNVSTASVLSDLVAWTDIYVANNGFAPGSMQTSQAVIRLMQRNTEIINAVYGATAGRTRVTLTELNDLLSSEGLPTLRAPYDSNVDVDGVTTRVIADDRLLFFPPNIGDLGSTTFGVSATALELMDSKRVDLAFEDAPGIVGVVEKVGPPYRQFTYVDAVAMPILKNAKLLMIADVK
jgi:hypothetical protein